MKSINEFKGKKIENMALINAGKRMKSANLITGGTGTDKIDKHGRYHSFVGLFDGPRD